MNKIKDNMLDRITKDILAEVGGIDIQAEIDRNTKRASHYTTSQLEKRIVTKQSRINKAMSKAAKLVHKIALLELEYAADELELNARKTREANSRHLQSAGIEWRSSSDEDWRV